MTKDISHNNKKLFLTEVAIIRPILIVLLVFYHAFAIYSGAWEPIDGISEVKAYWWLDKLSYAFMLEMFVFISGYVYGYQVRTKGECKLNAKDLFGGKFKRLIIPSMVFSLIYIILFQDVLHQSVLSTIYGVVAGTGHMWFLPMLFWCFAFLWLIERMNLRPRIIMPLLCILSIISFVPLPFHMGHTLYYMFFFYVGYIMQKHNVDVTCFYKPRVVVLLTITFMVLFVSFTLINKNFDMFNGEQLAIKVLRNSMSRLYKILYSSVGIAMLFTMVGVMEQRRTKPLDDCFIELGGLCMGVYLFQQFILKALYNCSEFVFLFGTYWLPWVGFVIALLGSLLFSWLFHKTKIGRFLIG